jgi:hypothetical protein
MGIDLGKLPSLTATLQTSRPQLAQTGVVTLVVLLGFGGILGVDIARHGGHWSIYDTLPIVVVIVMMLVVWYRVTLRYEFDKGVLSCRWWGYLQWQRELTSLRSVTECKTRGGSYLLFTWDDDERNVYLFPEELAKLASTDEDGRESPP